MSQSKWLLHSIFEWNSSEERKENTCVDSTFGTIQQTKKNMSEK
jgi:hypothetical protein